MYTKRHKKAELFPFPCAFVLCWIEYKKFAGNQDLRNIAVMETILWRISNDPHWESTTYAIKWFNRLSITRGVAIGAGTGAGAGVGVYLFLKNAVLGLGLGLGLGFGFGFGLGFRLGLGLGLGFGFGLGLGFEPGFGFDFNPKAAFFKKKRYWDPWYYRRQSKSINQCFNCCGGAGGKQTCMSFLLRI